MKMESNNSRTFSILPTAYEDDRSISDKIHLSTKAMENNQKKYSLCIEMATALVKELSKDAV